MKIERESNKVKNPTKEPTKAQFPAVFRLEREKNTEKLCGVGDF